MKAITVQLKTSEQELIIGKNYIVNHTGAKQKTSKLFTNKLN